MSISLNANFELLSAGLYLDARQQFNTIIEMKDFAETSIPDGFITYNKETQKHYVFSSSNTVDATLGKWREYNRGGGGSSEKQIKDWVSGSSYLEGDYIYHDGELYRCLATNNNVDFNETNWEQLTYGIDELSKEDVEGLLGLTEEEIEAMADLILDTEVRIDKTYSSSKIYTDIQQCLEDSKTYTLLELGKFSGVSYKIVTSTSEMTSESIIYLLANGNTYDMYIVEENGATTKIGDMDIDLSQYYTKTEIDNDFLKKADADGKYATMTTVNGKIDKDKIVTALDDTVTDEQVPSAILIKTELDKTNAKLGDKVDKSYVDDNFATMDKFTNYTKNIKFGETEDVDANNLKSNANYIFPEGYEGNVSNMPSWIERGGGLLECKIWGIYETQVFYPYGEGTVYIRSLYYYDNKFQWSNWKELATMDKLNYSTGEDVPKTTITPVFPNGLMVGSGGATINYIVRNGWCNVDFEFNIRSATALTWSDIDTLLPKPANNVNIVLINDGGKTYRPIPIKINSTGSLSLRVPNEISATDWWAGNVSYPVAES